MKITDIKVNLLDLPYPVPLQMTPTPEQVLKSQLYTLVRIYTDGGLMGVGASARDEARTVEKVVKPYLMGRDPLQLEVHVPVIRGTQTWLVDMALCDIVGKAANMPLYQLWGAHHDRVKAYVSCPAKLTAEARAESAVRLLEQGFRAIKVRIHNWTVEEDLAVVEKVREAVGDEMDIMVDANQAAVPFRPITGPIWTFERALKTARELEAHNVLWLEEPLGRYQYKNLARLCQESNIPIAGGEGNSGIHEFSAILEAEAYDILQPEPTISEGLSQMRKIAAAAEMHNRLFIPHHGNSGIGLAAVLQLTASLPNSPWVEYNFDPPYRTIEAYQQMWGIVKDPMLIDSEGYVSIPDKPGLGLELDESLIEKYEVA